MDENGPSFPRETSGGEHKPTSRQITHAPEAVKEIEFDSQNGRLLTLGTDEQRLTVVRT